MLEKGNSFIQNYKSKGNTLVPLKWLRYDVPQGLVGLLVTEVITCPVTSTSVMAWKYRYFVS